MKQTLSLHDFRNEFINWDTYKDNFSYDGLRLLFEYIEEYEEATDCETELDVVAICCEYSEMTANELLNAYNFYTIDEGAFEELDEDAQVLAIEEHLQYQTSYLGYTDNNTFVFANW